MTNFACCLQKLLARVRQECIYKDSSRIMLVRLNRVEQREDQLLLSLEPISTPGFSPKLPSTFEVSGNTEFMVFKKNYISNPYANFLLFIDQGDVTRLVRFASTLPDIDALLAEFRAVMRSDFKVKADQSDTKASDD